MEAATTVSSGMQHVAVADRTPGTARISLTASRL